MVTASIDEEVQFLTEDLLDQVELVSNNAIAS